VIHVDMTRRILAWPRLRGNVLTCGDAAPRYTRYVPGSALSPQFRWQIRTPSRHLTAEARSVSWFLVLARSGLTCDDD
jgi:hypothetical protein